MSQAQLAGVGASLAACCGKVREPKLREQRARIKALASPKLQAAAKELGVVLTGCATTLRPLRFLPPSLRPSLRPPLRNLFAVLNI